MAVERAAVRPRFSPGLAVFLVAAVAFGAAASLLAAPSNVPTYVIAGTEGGSLFSSTTELGGLLLLGAIGAFMVYRMATYKSLPGTSVAVSAFLIVFLVCVGFIVAFHFVGGSPGGGSSGTLGHNGSGGKGVPPPGGVGTNLSGNGSGVPPTWFSFPTWLPYALLLGAVAVAVLVALPFAVAVMRDRETKTPPIETRESIRSSITRALHDLDAGGAVDPRQRIIAVYAQLLARIDTAKGRLDSLTPREIEIECTTRLRVTPATAHELTALFEEARYSAHPMTGEAVDRARAALNRALSDLNAPSVLA